MVSVIVEDLTSSLALEDLLDTRAKGLEVCDGKSVREREEQRAVMKANAQAGTTS